MSTIFAYIYTWFARLSSRFDDIADWLDEQGWPWYYLAPPFRALHDITDTIADYFYDVYKAARNIENILYDAWDRVTQVFDYVYDVLKDKVNDALNAVEDAFDYAYAAFRQAVDAWNYATGWLKDKVIEAYNMAVSVFGQIGDAVAAKAQEIYAWVRSIPLEIKSFIDGVVVDVKAWVTGIVPNIEAGILSTIAAPFNLITLWFDEIQAFFNSPLDWLVDRFTDWFLGPEK